MNTKIVKTVAKRPKPPAAGKGRSKGSLNKFTRQLKDMILAALDEAGGQAYLARQADESPAAFMALIGKVLPIQSQTLDENGKPAAPAAAVPVFNITMRP